MNLNIFNRVSAKFEKRIKYIFDTNKSKEIYKKKNSI